MPAPFGLIGYGAIGTEIGRVLTHLGETGALKAVLVREGRNAERFAAVHSADALCGNGIRTVLECAGHAAVREHGAAVLRAGLDLVVTSIGALSDPRVAAELSAAAQGGGRLLLAPGAVGGLDGLLAARLGGLASASYTSIKPPHAWRGTPAEGLIDYDNPAEEQVLFDGTAREAAARFPKNANVAVAVGLCALGLDDTRAVLVSSRKVSDPLGVIEAAGAFGRMRYETFAHAAPANPKTSLLTAYSLLQCARLGQGIPVLDLL
ncbi:MAG: aspartate dehydrogenase [Alphaproteobacteria bacterium]|nr:aspartate dehydrogenase [Alphaproteobacteria bacterium]